MTGYGSLFAIDLKDTDFERLKTFVNALTLVTIGVSWGGFESLVMPVWKGSNEEELKKRGLDIGHIRMYIGLEEVELLIEDLQNAFNHAYQ